MDGPDRVKFGLMITCPSCRQPLNLTEPIRCQSCGTSYDAPFGVPILFKGAHLERVAEPSSQFVADMSSALGADPQLVKECFSLRVKMPNQGVQIEADQFVGRMRSSGFTIAIKEAPPAPAAHAVNVASKISLRLEALVWPSALEAGQRYSANVRIANEGGCAISSKASDPLYIAYHWLGEGRSPIEGHRTHLLIDLLPGRSLTMPVLFTAPNEPGEYTLEISPILENVAWLKQFSVFRMFQVLDKAPALGWIHDTSMPPRSYADDHKHGVALLGQWMDAHVRNPDPIILEIGGNYNPMTAALPKGQRWNLDVDAHGLMALNIGGGGGVKSIVADGCDLPFADQSLDVVTMFATFHHFPDPIGLLKHLGTKVKADGLVCLMCEPIGHVTAQHDYPAYFQELEAGVNEQSFEIWEYMAMLSAAGLEVLDAKFEQGSAKIAARLKP